MRKETIGNSISIIKKNILIENAVPFGGLPIRKGRKFCSGVFAGTMTGLLLLLESSIKRGYFYSQGKTTNQVNWNRGVRNEKDNPARIYQE